MTLSRRRALSALIAGSVGLPWLEALSARQAHAQTRAPQRFVVMFSANGTLHERWAPRGTSSDFALSPILEPLTPHEDDLVIVDGLEQMGAGGDQHQRGMGGMLTGAGLLPGSFGGMAAAPSGWAEGPSVDQRIAETIARGTPFRSLELGVQVRSADNSGRMCYRARNQPLPPREDPAAVFDDVFAGSLLSPEERERRRARRTSLLDYVRADLARLSAELGGQDRERLERHATYVREVERRLDEAGASVDRCELPAPPPAASSDNDRFPEIGELQSDLLVLALACGRTRVASLQWSRSVSFTRFTWLGIDEDHHELSHRPDADTAAQDKLEAINRWYAARFAGLIERLKRYEEGDGTLFDHCLLLWSNELGRGNTHSPKPMPYVLAGSAGGALKTGRWLTYEGGPHNDLLLSLLRVYGISDSTFGRPEWCTGPLSGLL